MRDLNTPDGPTLRWGDAEAMMQGANAYAKVARSALSPREAEAAVLLKAAGRLQAFSGQDLSNSAGLNEALMFNQKVWTILAGAVADPVNPLPDEIRQNVTNIALYVFRTIIDVMIQPTAAKLETLVSLNNHLAAGLQGSPTPSAT